MKYLIKRKKMGRVTRYEDGSYRVKNKGGVYITTSSRKHVKSILGQVKEESDV